MTYLEGLNKVIEAIGKLELDQNTQQTTYLGLIAMQIATMNDELARMNGNYERNNLSIPSVEPSYKPNIDEVKTAVEPIIEADKESENKK